MKHGIFTSRPMRLLRRIVILFFIFFLLAALAATAFAVALFTEHPHTRILTVPQLVGAYAEDLPLGGDQGLYQIVSHGQYHSAPAGTVLAQDPPAGSRRKARKGARYVTLTLTVSLGTERIETPPLVGLSLCQARAALSEQDFRLEAQEVNSDLPRGTVLSQSPLPGTKAERHATVSLTVSRGPLVEKVRVPDLTHRSEREAKSLVEAYGLILGEIIRVPSQEREGIILSQTPVAGISLPRGKSVTITVASPIEEKDDSTPFYQKFFNSDFRFPFSGIPDERNSDTT